MALIFGVSSMPQPTGNIPLGRWDVVVHAAEYGGLGLLVARALVGGWNRPFTAAIVLTTVVICTLYGITDEIHQYFVPPRTPDVQDVVADMAGSTIAALACYLWARKASDGR
jgi:VanZ family protein